jgi:protein SOK2
MSNQRSMPTTPATTPPGNNLQGMPSYQGQSGYDSKPYYSAAPQSHSQYAPHTPLAQPGMPAYGQSIPGNSYVKNEMAPPTARGSGTAEPEAAELKSDRYPQSNTTADGVQEQEHEYLQDGAGYNANRGSYTYTTNPSVGSLAGEHSQLTPEMTGSPQQNGSGRMTPRTGGGAPPHWASEYNTPPRPSAAGSLYNIVSDTRGTPANGASTDPYSMASASTPVYQTATAMNGGSMGSGSKRMREDDDLPPPAEYGTKRRKTLTDTTIGGPVGGAPLLQPMKAPQSVMSRRR